MKNGRCWILEVAPVALIYMALSFIHRISTDHMSSNKSAISGLEDIVM